MEQTDHELIEALLKRVDALEAQVAELKKSVPQVDEEILLAIVGAVSAYLGVKAKVRAIHYGSSTRWAQIGRSANQRHTIS